MKSTEWAEENQRALMGELATLRCLLRGQPNDAETQPPASSAALDQLATKFGLSTFERRIVLLCAGVELAGDFADDCAAAAGSNGNAFPSFALALAVFPDAHWDALSASAPLRKWRLVETIGNGPLVSRRLQLDERILFFLTGVEQLDERLVNLIEPLPATSETPSSHQETLARLTSAWRSAFAAQRTLPVLQLCGSDVSGKRALAAAAAACLTSRIYRLRAPALPLHLPDLDALQRAWEREAILQNAALFLECDDAENSEAAIARWIDHTRTPLVLSTREPRREMERPILTVEVRKPTRAEQRLVWEKALGAEAAGLNGQLDRLVAQFDFSTAEIHSTARGSLGNSSDLWESCRLQARPRLRDLAQQISSRATFADLVLPTAQLDILHTIAAQVRQRAKVHDEWGFAAQSSRGLGLGALFSGPSGTGKTLAAEILANEMQLDLFRIDLSAVVSKYIGETEKNLSRVFDAAEEGGAVLLFDEADALFGKRSEVKDSHDRYANVEISYLLQRMEAYRGLAILTTNMKEALDPAFLRRLRFVVQFPFPDQAQRTEIWRKIFPKNTPTVAVDLECLSRLTITGGNIRSIALNAAFAAADAHEPVRMSHLLGAARREYEKLEKPLTNSEIGGWR